MSTPIVVLATIIVLGLVIVLTGVPTCQGSHNDNISLGHVLLAGCK